MYSRLGIWKTKSGIKIPQSCTYSSIYGPLGHFCGVGKFSSTMEHWGLRNSCLQRIKMETWSLAVEQPPVGAEVQILSWKLPLTTLETKGHSSMLHVWRKQIPTYTFGLLLGYMLRSMVLDGKLQFLFFFYTTWVSILDFALFLDGELSQVTQDFGGTTDPHRWRFLAILKGQELGTRIVG